MKVLIKPKITINEPVKNKCFGFHIVLSKKDQEELTVKAKSSDGRSRGIVGKITKGGTFIPSSTYKTQLPIITTKVQMKIDILLDLIYGKKRDRKVEVRKDGLVHFINHKTHVK